MVSNWYFLKFDFTIFHVLQLLNFHWYLDKKLLLKNIGVFTEERCRHEHVFETLKLQRHFF